MQPTDQTSIAFVYSLKLDKERKSSSARSIVSFFNRLPISREHDFRSSVPSGSDVFRHEACPLCFRLICGSCESKVANLEVTICVEEEVGGLQISMEDLGGMQGFQAS